MSNTCFSCHAKIKEDSYGLTQCPDCHTFVFIDFDGHVQKPPEKVQEPEKPQTSPSTHLDQDSIYEPQKQDEISNDFETPLDPLHQSDTMNSPQETLQDTDSHDKQESPTNPIGADLLKTDSVETHPIETDSLETGPVRTASVERSVEASLGTQPVEAASLSSPENNQLQDVIDYANRSEDIADGFYYNVMISGIDSKTLRQSVMDALDDPRFGWKKENILIKNGCLTIEKINSAKTYILMSYLKFLPVKIKWDQVSLIK